MSKNHTLRPPASYFPIKGQGYTINPGLFPLHTDFGNAGLDRCTFQIDDQFDYFMAEKRQCRIEQLDKYFLTHSLLADTASTINAFIISTLVRDYANLFRLQHNQADKTLHCKLTGKNIIISPNHSHLSEQITLFDQLAMQCQEDLAIVQLDEQHNNTLSALHLCFPNYWSAQEKIGRNFIAVHQPVPGMDRINQRAFELIQAIIEKGPYVRFAWGLTTDKRLNHHPLAPAGIDPLVWHGRDFNTQRPKLYMRVERQTMHGFPEQMAVLFTIRTYFHDVGEIKKDQQKKQRLLEALSTMPTASLAYKGLTQSRVEILKWLKNGV